MAAGDRADGGLADGTGAERDRSLEQPVASVAPEDVDRLARREFGEDGAAAVRTMLEELEGDRLRAAVLMLAGGDLMTLRERIGDAQADPLDVLAAAEYRSFCDLPPDAAEADRRAAVAADAQRYRDWFEGA